MTWGPRTTQKPVAQEAPPTVICNLPEVIALEKVFGLEARSRLIVDGDAAVG